MSDRGYRISSRRADGSTRVGIAFSLLVNDSDKFFLPVPAAHANDGGEIAIENAKIGQLQMAAPDSEGEHASCCSYVAVPVDPFDLPTLPNLRPPSIDSLLPVVLTEVSFGNVAGYVARTQFRHDLTNPNRTELGTLVHLTEITKTMIPLGSVCTAEFADWGVVAAVDRGGRAVVVTPLTTVLTGFQRHGLRLATAEDIDRAFAIRFRMLPFALPAHVEAVQAVFELADRLTFGKKPLVIDAPMRTFDDFLNAIEYIGKVTPLITRQNPLPALTRFELPSLFDKDEPHGHLWIDFGNARVTLRQSGDVVPESELSAASFLQQVRKESAA